MNRRLFVLFALVVSSAALFVAGLGAQSAPPPAISLFQDALVGFDARAAVPGIRPDTVEQRLTAINPAAFDAPALRIDLFGSESIVARKAALAAPAGEATVWSGTVDGQPLSSVTFVQVDGVVQGSIRTERAAYSIEPAGAGAYVLREVDLSQAGVEMEPRVPDLSAARVAAADIADVPMDDGTIFDVLVVYTAAARTAAGGSDAAIRARIALGVAETNTAYQNSGITPRLRLVGAELVSYAESPTDLGVDLDRLRLTSDGFMDAVHTRRNELAADLVQLVVGSSNSSGCGVAYLMTIASQAFSSLAFSVTGENCISPNYTFGHELGHNMGSHHAPEDAGGDPALYPYSYGYKHPSRLFRTVMAYDCSGGCPRILHFSNPGVSYQGNPTGVVNTQNNALSIHNARMTIANWRTALSSAPPTIGSVAAQTTNEDTATGAIPFTVGDSDTPLANLIVSAASSDSTLVPAAGLVLGGAAGSRTVTITPAANGSGVTTITLTVSDGVSSAQETFPLTVTAVNDAPTFGASTPTSAITTPGTLVGFAVTLSDIDSAGSSLALTGESLTPALLPVYGVQIGPTNSTANSHTFQVNLTPAAGQSGTAQLRLRGRDNLGAERTFDFTLQVVASLPAPLPPTDIETSVSANTLGVGWTPATTGAAATSYRVEIGTSPGAVSFPVATVHAPTTSTSVVVAPGVYYIRVRAVNASGTSGPSAEASVVVGSTAVLPGIPRNFAVATAGTTAMFTWIPPATGGGVSTYVIEAGSSPGLSDLAVLNTGSGATSYTVPNVPPGAYYVRVRAGNAGGFGSPSAELTLVMTPAGRCVSLAGPPVQLQPLVAGNNVQLRWTAPTTGGAPVAYVVSAGSTPGASDIIVYDTNSAALSLGAVAANGAYFVRVAGRNACGIGAASNEVSFTLGVPPPDAPTAFAATVGAGGLVSLSWTAPAGGTTVAQYVLEAGSASGLANLAVLPTGGGATTFDVVAPTGVYHVRVRAANSSGAGAASNEIVVVVP